MRYLTCFLSTNNGRGVAKMMKKHISILLSALLIVSSGFTTIYAEGEPSSSPTIEATQQPEPTETPEISTDNVETEEPDTNVEVGEDSSSENESEEVTEPSATETPEVTPAPETNEDTSKGEEELDPSVSYTLQYADGTSAEDVISSEELSTDKAIQKITLNTLNIEPSMVTYNVYLSNYGWSEEKHGGEVAGKDDGSNIEGFYAKLDDSLKEMYSIEYRTYISGFGWTEWARDGEYTGSKDYGLAITSLDVRIVYSDVSLYASNGTGQAYYERPSVQYNVHMQDYGWLGTVGTSQVSGRPNQGKRVEAITVTLPANLTKYGSLNIQTHVQDYGWLGNVGNGQVAGTTGQGKRVEAFQLSLTGELANRYNILYQAYVDGLGWQPTKKNGAVAGTTGQSRAIQAIRISIQYKYGPQSSTGMSESEYIQNLDQSIFYQAHVQNIGWQNTVMNYETAGTTGQSLRVESLKVTLSDDLAQLGGVSIRAHVQDYGWMNSVGAGAVIGTTGQSKRLEAVQMSLTGELANKFDICYRTHVQNIGWQSWKRNGETSGTTGQSLRIEAIQIAIVQKSSNSSSNSNANRVEVGVDVSSWQGNQIDWNQVSTVASFAIVRAGYRGASGRVAEDTCAVRNVNAAKSAGMQVGLYFYSIATNIFQAMEEADIAVNVANKCGGVSLPIYFDMEDNRVASLSRQDKTTIANAFIDRVHSYGYNAGFYSYLYWMKDQMDMNGLRSDSVWVAQYNNTCTYTGKYDFWQYTSQGSVPGISGNVDMNKRIR